MGVIILVYRIIYVEGGNIIVIKVMRMIIVILLKYWLNIYWYREIFGILLVDLFSEGNMVIYYIVNLDYLISDGFERFYFL